jgi:hypothetical protein
MQQLNVSACAIYYIRNMYLAACGHTGMNMEVNMEKKNGSSRHELFITE